MAGVTISPTTLRTGPPGCTVRASNACRRFRTRSEVSTMAKPIRVRSVARPSIRSRPSCAAKLRLKLPMRPSEMKVKMMKMMEALRKIWMRVARREDMYRLIRASVERWRHVWRIVRWRRRRIVTEMPMIIGIRAVSATGVR